MAAPELPRAMSESPSRGDTWRPRSCPELGAGARAVGTHGRLRATLNREAGAVVLDLKFVRGDTRSLGYRQRKHR
jgi:hypothetical protein